MSRKTFLISSASLVILGVIFGPSLVRIVNNYMNTQVIQSEAARVKADTAKRIALANRAAADERAQAIQSEASAKRLSSQAREADADILATARRNVADGLNWGQEGETSHTQTSVMLEENNVAQEHECYIERPVSVSPYNWDTVQNIITIVADESTRPEAIIDLQSIFDHWSDEHDDISTPKGHRQFLRSVMNTTTLPPQVSVLL